MGPMLGKPSYFFSRLSKYKIFYILSVGFGVVVVVVDVVSTIDDVMTGGAGVTTGALWSHKGPMKPAWHVHLKFPTPSLVQDPYLHGLGTHGSVSKLNMHYIYTVPFLNDLLV